jgi:hypothetical protein
VMVMIIDNNNWNGVHMNVFCVCVRVCTCVLFDYFYRKRTFSIIVLDFSYMTNIHFENNKFIHISFNLFLFIDLKKL